MKLKKLFLTLLLLVCVLGNTVITAFAASSDEWYIHYIPGAPSNISNQSDTLYVAYYSEGYFGDCTSFSGGRYSYLEITSTSAGGINNYYRKIVIGGTGITLWRMRSSTTGNVCFKVMANGEYSCTSNGAIKVVALLEENN